MHPTHHHTTNAVDVRFQQEATCLRRTINMSHIKNHYFTSHPSLNCYSIVPTGPGVMKDLEAPHHRDDAAQRVWP